MKVERRQGLRWFGAIVILLLIFLLVVRPRLPRGNRGLPDDHGDGSRASSFSRSSLSEKGRRISSSRRKLSEHDELNAHTVCLDDEESVVFPVSGVGRFDGLLVFVTPERVVYEDGKQVTRVLAKVIDPTEAKSPDAGITSLVNQTEKNRILGRLDGQLFIRSISRTAGVDLMTLPTRLIDNDRDEKIEFLLIPGLEELLLIEGRLQEGRDGKTRLKLGHPFICPREERKDLLGEMGLPLVPE